MISFCPGSFGLKGTPNLKVKTCPECGADVEVFSNMVKTACAKCGFPIYNDTISCVSWCKYARECVGDELYEQFTGKGAADAGQDVTSQPSAAS